MPTGIYNGPTIEQRFFQLARPTVGCWGWHGEVSIYGYARMYIRGRNTNASRVAFLLSRGQWPKQQIDHLCRNTRCVNPNHLEDVPSRINVRRSTNPAALNALKTHCKRGHEYAGDNLSIRKNQKGRTCRACRRDDARRLSRKNHQSRWNDKEKSSEGE